LPFRPTTITPGTKHRQSNYYGLERIWKVSGRKNKGRATAFIWMSIILKRKRPVSHTRSGAFFIIIPGGDLLSHTVTHAVPSALRGLTSVFGMGTGVTPSA
jgi:hypothetical protein